MALPVIKDEHTMLRGRACNRVEVQYGAELLDSIQKYYNLRAQVPKPITCATILAR